MGLNATLLVQMAVFAAFVWFTMKFVWPPITKAMEERQTRISEGLAAAERGTRELANAQGEKDAVLREAREQAANIVAQANARHAEIVEEAKSAAQTEADRIQAGAQAELDQQVAQAREALRAQVATLAVEGAGRVINKELDASAHSALLDDLATRL